MAFPDGSSNTNDGMSAPSYHPMPMLLGDNYLQQGFQQFMQGGMQAIQQQPQGYQQSPYHQHQQPPLQQQPQVPPLPSPPQHSIQAASTTAPPANSTRAGDGAVGVLPDDSNVTIDNPAGGDEEGDTNYKQPPLQQEHDVAERELSSSLGLNGDCTFNIPKIGEILTMNPQQCRAELDKINKDGKKVNVYGNLPTLRVRIYDYYYPPDKETVTVYLSTGRVTDFKAEKFNDTCCKVTMVLVQKGLKGLVTMQSLGVGSNIVSINNEPLTAQYPDGQPVMTMACKLFNGDIGNTTPKFIRVVPAVPVSNNTVNNNDKRKRVTDTPSSNPKSTSSNPKSTKAPKRRKCSAPNSAGACSKHGPAKKCDTEGCTSIVVQGGKCITHGARRGCTRSIPHGAGADQSRIQHTESYCIPVGSESVATKKNDTPSENYDGMLLEEEPKSGNVEGGFVVDGVRGKQQSLPTDDGSKQQEVAGNTKPNGVYTQHIMNLEQNFTLAKEAALTTAMPDRQKTSTAAMPEQGDATPATSTKSSNALQSAVKPFVQSTATPHNKSSTEVFTPVVAKTAVLTSTKPVAVTSSPLHNHQNKALSSPSLTRDLEKEEAEKEPEGNTTNQGSGNKARGNKENVVSSNDNDKVESGSGESNAATIDAELLAFSEAVEASNEDNLLEAWTVMYRNNTPKHVINLIGLAQKELDKSDEGLLLAEKEKAEADKKRFKKKMESYVQDAMELDNVDENGKADMRGNKNYEACEKKVNELEGKLSVINTKLGNKKIIVNRLKETFDKTFENIVKDVTVWWSSNRDDEPTFLAAEKTKWNDFWENAMMGI